MVERVVDRNRPYRICVSRTLDPYWNLAVEECLLDQAAHAPPRLLLWRSSPAVIIGKNQNPWRECDLEWMHRQRVRLARRSSGGGAVYHDEGNLNYAVFMPRTDYHADHVLDQVMSVLARFGLNAHRLNRTGLAIEGRKISGSAFCYRRNAVLHHGTLLVEANLSALQHALKPSTQHWVTKATASIPAPVVNLKTLRKDLNVPELIRAFQHVLGGDEPASAPGDWLTDDDLAEPYRRLQSPAWLYEQTPAFELHTTLNGQSVTLRVEKGIIKEIHPAPPGAAWVGQHYPLP